MQCYKTLVTILYAVRILRQDSDFSSLSNPSVQKLTCAMTAGQ